MSKKFKAAASSSRVQAGGFGSGFGSGLGSGFGASSTGPALLSTISNDPSGQLHYVYQPPDLTAVSDPSVVVSLKNVQKSSGTTKSKALDELLAYLESLRKKGGEVEDGLLEAWISLYARTSIDNSRSVRQKAQTLQGRLTAMCGKRMAKHLPSSAGPWLCGLRDNDKIVVRSTQQALEEAFPTEEKRLGLWKIYYKSILAYCTSVICNESSTTLSDERTTSADDAEAKYHRTIAAAVLTLARTFEAVPQDLVRSEIESYRTVFNAKSFWALASCRDSFARQAVYTAVTARLKTLRDNLDNENLNSIAAGLIGKGLRADQTGSSTAFVTVLAAVTAANPTLWTDHYSSKKHTAPENLVKFLRNMPPGPPSDFWAELDRLFEFLPTEILLYDNEASSDPKGPQGLLLLTAMHSGMSRRENYRHGLGLTWESYLNLAKRIMSKLQDPSRKSDLVKQFLCPLIRRYVLLEAEDKAWMVAEQDASHIALKTFLLAIDASSASMVEFSKMLSSSVIDKIRISLPELSKDFKASQDGVEAVIRRWGGLKIKLLKQVTDLELENALTNSISSECEAAIEVLKTRQGKPYGAVESLVVTLDLLKLHSSHPTKQTLTDFLTNDAPKLIGSPATRQLISLLQLAEAAPLRLKVYDTCLIQVLDQADPTEKSKNLTYFLEHPWPKDSTVSEKLQEIVEKCLIYYQDGDLSQANMIDIAAASVAAPASLVDGALRTYVHSLSIDDRQETALRGLDLITSRNPSVVQSYILSERKSDIVPKLILLSQNAINQNLKQKAQQLGAKIQALSNKDDNPNGFADTIVSSLKDGLQDTALEVSALISLATQAIGNAKEPGDLANELFPGRHDWEKVLMPHIIGQPSPLLSITNDLAGAVYVVKPWNMPTPSAAYDHIGLSLAARMAQYTLELFKLLPKDLHVATEVQVAVLNHLVLFNEVASDNLNVEVDVPLWKRSVYSDEEAAKLLSVSQHAVREHMFANKALRNEVVSGLKRFSDGDSTLAYYLARAYVTVAQLPNGQDSPLVVVTEEELLGRIKSGKISMRDYAECVIATQSSTLAKVTNSLVADLARQNLEKHHTDSLGLLNFLNITLQAPSFQASVITQKHRLVLYVKHVASILDDDEISMIVKAEILRSLTVFLPTMKDIFDTFWEEVILAMDKFFADPETSVPLVHATLRLYSVLAELAAEDEDISEDFLESWSSNLSQIQMSLLSLLTLRAAIATNSSQPDEIVDTMISRHVDGINPPETDLDAVYLALMSHSASLQEAAYKYLHLQIPKLQEKVVLDAALAKDFKAKLPEGLLNVVETTSHDIYELQPLTTIPTPLLQTILGWKLIFDHWTGASYQVQLDYVTQIKETGSYKDLLDTIFDYTITSRAKPFNPAKVSLTSFAVEHSADPERKVPDYLCHLYFLLLLHTPALVRSWVRDDCPRSLQKVVSDWTEEYMSPSLIEAELGEVSRWAPKQETDTPLEVKVSFPAREVTAMYPVDEQMAAIRVALPADYPLSPITVEDLNRVGVDTKKWQSWLINAQGIINFAPSSGGLGAVTDGLVAWRRNVTGTLKGQSECAICYSIVNADRQLPTKKCGICKNAFHGACLYRWFKSSGGSSCPLCRNAFNYG